MKKLAIIVTLVGVLVGCSTSNVAHTNNEQQLILKVDQSLLQPVEKPVLLQKTK